MFDQPKDWEHKPTVGFSKFPEGVYKFSVTKAAIETNDYGEHLVKVEFTCIEGEYKNRKFFKSFRFSHPELADSQKAYKHWVSTCKSIGKKIDVNNPATMEGNILNLGLKVYKRDDGKEYQYIDTWPDADAKVKGGTAAPAQAVTTHTVTTPNGKITEQMDDLPF